MAASDAPVAVLYPPLATKSAPGGHFRSHGPWKHFSRAL